VLEIGGALWARKAKDIEVLCRVVFRITGKKQCKLGVKEGLLANKTPLNGGGVRL